MNNSSLGHRAPLLWLLPPFAAGCTLGRLADAPPAAAWLLAGAAVTAGAAVWWSRKKPFAWAVALGLTMVLAGAAAYATQARRLRDWDELPAREARLELRVERSFAAAGAGKTSGLARITGADAPLRELAGQRVYFSLRLPPGTAAPIRSAIITAEGTLETPPRHPPPDSFDDYLANAGIHFKLTRGRLLAEKKPAAAYGRFCERARARFFAILGTGIAAQHPELAGELRAMMLSEKHELNAGQQGLFMHSGTMHLFAISGLHIGVIATVLHALLGLLRLPRWPRFLIGGVLLWLYVDITGGSPSAVRAFVMVIFLEAALTLRKPGNALAALTAAAFVVLLADPAQLFTASYQMSYGIVGTLLLLGLPLGEAWQARWKLFADLPEVSWTWWMRALAWVQQKLLAALGLGVATALVAAVTGIAFFHLFTPGAVAANLALIPLASVAIMAGFASILCGLAGWSAASDLFNHAAALVLAVIERLIRMCVSVPGSYFPATFASPWWGGSTLATLVALCLAGYALRWRRGIVWVPFALLALVMILGVNFG